MATGPHHGNTNAQGLRMQLWGNKSSSFPSWLCSGQSQALCSSLGHWAGLNSMQDKKIITGETEGMGPKSGSGKVGYGMLKLACQAGILKAGP